MLDEELNETAVKAKAIAEIVEIALNNLMKVDLSVKRLWRCSQSDSNSG